MSTVYKLAHELGTEYAGNTALFRNGFCFSIVPAVYLFAAANMEASFLLIVNDFKSQC